MEFQAYQKLVNAISIGKQLPDAIYLHESALKLLPHALSTHVARAVVDLGLDEEHWNIVKFFKRDHKIALLSYPSFFEDSYPSLHQSITVDLEKLTFRKADYSKSANPPILHRKETFLVPNHPEVPRFREITEEGIQAGLYEKTRNIGFKQSWERLISRKGYRLIEGRLISKSDSATTFAPVSHEVAVARHLTAIDRNKLSAPMQVLARHNYFDGNYSIFDYGCGKGDDVRELEAHGLDVDAWDPVYRSDAVKRKADIVNLGYVVNVIEDRTERNRVLQDAYQHSKKVLVISAMIAGEVTISQFKPYKDGVITLRNTFQKYYSQSELRSYIETTLEEIAIAAGPGIFLVFRDKVEEQLFLSERQRVRRDWTQLTERGRVTPQLRISKDIIERNRELFDDLWHTVLDLGRVPANPEYEFSERIRAIAGSHAKAFQTLREYYGDDIFKSAQQSRKDDLLVYFSLGLFGKRKAYRHMPDGLKRDLKTFFGSYQKAIEKATNLLFSVGSTDNISKACEQVYEQLGCGKIVEGHSLTIHRSYLSELPPILRIYVGCATQLYGDIEDIDLIKIHMTSSKISLMKYDDFCGHPLPELIERIKIKLRDQEIDIFDYTGEYDPQPLYLKSQYLQPGFANYENQRAFDEKLTSLNLFDFSGFGPSRREFYESLDACKLHISGYLLV